MAHSTRAARWLARTGATVVLLTAVGRSLAQSPPRTADRPWHSGVEQQIMRDARSLLSRTCRIESDRTYSLTELIDRAEAHNPETRVAWENARDQVAALGIARSDLFPTLAVLALASVDRGEVGFGSRFYRQTLPSF